MLVRRLTCVAVVAVAVFVGAAPGAMAAKPGGGGTTGEPIPNSMSSLGDSITRAFNACGWFVDCPERSWSTGTYASVNSHYLRILNRNRKINGRNSNDSRSGARMVDLDGQAASAVSRGVEYVTIAMGANDACTSSEASMTPVETYRAQFQAAINRISGALPTARIFVASVPDIKRLWFIGKDSSSARNAWASFGICQSMLANPTSTDPADEDRRNRVRQRVIDFNTALAAVCSATPHCKFDGNAVFNFQFMLSHMSTWDYFHPNTSGQTAAADVTYRAGFGW